MGRYSGVVDPKSGSMKASVSTVSKLLLAWKELVQIMGTHVEKANWAWVDPSFKGSKIGNVTCPADTTGDV